MPLSGGHGPSSMLTCVNGFPVGLCVGMAYASKFDFGRGCSTGLADSSFFTGAAALAVVSVEAVLCGMFLISLYFDCLQLHALGPISSTSSPARSHRGARELGDSRRRSGLCSVFPLSDDVDVLRSRGQFGPAPWMRLDAGACFLLNRPRPRPLLRPHPLPRPPPDPHPPFSVRALSLQSARRRRRRRALARERLRAPQARRNRRPRPFPRSLWLGFCNYMLRRRIALQLVNIGNGAGLSAVWQNTRDEASRARRSSAS